MEKPIIVVSDTSPIISLALLDQLELLTTLFTEVYIPFAVWEELTEARLTENLPKIQAFFKGKVKQIQGENYLFPFVDYGEAEAMLMSKEIQVAYLIVDDKRARDLVLHVSARLAFYIEQRKKGLFRNYARYLCNYVTMIAIMLNPS
jgi:predicted nucleic acid-binding protein